MAKWLLANTKIIIIDEPTRGIDIGAEEEIYKLMYDLKAAGNSIIMISSELPEIIRVSDRAIVMSKGTIMAELRKEDISEKAIMDHAIQ